MDTQGSNMRADLIEIEKLKKVLNEALLEGNQTVNHYLDLGWAYRDSYSETHQQQDLDSAITSYKGGLDYCAGDTECQLELWYDLGTALRCHYEKFGNLSHQDEAIGYATQGLNLCPLDHPLRLSYLFEYAWLLKTRSEQTGDLDDMESAIISYDQALSLCPPDHPDRPMSLHNLANALQDRYEQLGEIEDLEKAIMYNQQVLKLHPTGRPDRPTSLNNLAVALQTRYKQLGEADDLEKAITCNQQALELRPPGHPDRSMSLNNLAMALQGRYEQFGEIEDLEKAITWNQQAFELHPPGHPNRSMSFNNLAIAFQTRYKQLGEIEDLDKAITWNQQALELCPPGHPKRSLSLNNLASTLRARYEQLGEIEDLQKAITCNQQVLELRPPGHPDRSMSMNNLAIALQTRYRQLGRAEDLEEAITWNQQALELRPPGHTLRSSTLSNLANGLGNRYEQLGEIQDLEKAIICNQQALELRPPGHPYRSLSLNNLAIALKTRYQELGNQQDLENAISYHKEAASAISGLDEKLKGAKEWAIISHRHGFSSAIPAYSLALNVLQQHLSLLPSITSQQKLVEKHSYLSLDAAACAISAGTPEMAVQLLEQGRSILWSKIQGYRQSLGDIAQKAPQLAQEFQLVSKQLEHNTTSGNMDFTLQRALSERWTSLLAEIRNLNGFSDYMQATPFSILQSVSAEGPVIMVNISHYRSDAIILASKNSPAVVPLHEVSPKLLKQLVDQLSSATSSSDPSKITYKVLQQLWRAIVNPVVKQLVQLGVSEKSHIWWCPTSYLCALPLHAAGPYKKGLKNLPDLYISSYTPTLASLLRARSDMPRPQSVPALLLVSQPDDTIPHVFEEAEIVNSLQVQITSCSGHDADKEGVVVALQTHPWVHFACHGHLDAQPFNSWFQLHNKEHLTVLDLAKAQLPNAEFAFLSACHSAAGDVHGTPDESIHLAGALQFSGFRSVVGTLWAMIDDVGPSIASEFYKHTFHNPGSVDLRGTAAALNVAVKELRRQNVSVDRWTNFIHIGA